MSETRNPFRPRLPALVDGRPVWPRWPVTRVTSRMLREGVIPPRPYRCVGIIDGFPIYLFAWPVFWHCLKLGRWYLDARWCLERLAVRCGVMWGPEGCYYHELEVAPIRQWFRGNGMLWWWLLRRGR